MKLPVFILLLVPLPARADDFFTSQVLPILKDHCYECHSHQSGKMKGGLTLDSPTGWQTGGDTGPAITPGKPDDSLLITAVRYHDSDYEMPPEEKLPDEKIAILVDWVKRGAPDPRKSKLPKSIDTNWWSLQPLGNPSPPAGGHPIDAFINQKLASKNLSPSPPADRTTLARRVYVDLHGYLPTPGEIDSFIKNKSPNATSQLIDQLLSSPRYGERWTRHWLDTIHFADTHGCEHDHKRPNAWRYRDYVITRLNDDVPYARFIREQLAPDVFFPNEPQLTAGLGFIAAGPLELSRAETEKLAFDYLDRDDIVTQTMAAFTSTTANCARCHNHKFDPVSQEDYFALQAVFAGVGKGDIEFEPSQEIKSKRQQLHTLLTATERKDPDQLLLPEHQPVIQSWINKNKNDLAFWQPLKPDTFLTTHGSTLTKQNDGSFYAHGHLPDQEVYTLTTSLPLKKLTALRLDVLRDDRLPHHGPGRAENGNLHLSEASLQYFPPHATEPLPLKISRASASFDQEGWTSAQSIDGNVETGWAIHPRVNQSHHIVFQLAEPLNLTSGGKLVITLKQLHPPKHLIGRFSLSATDSPNAQARALPADVINALNKPTNQHTKTETLALAAIALRDHAEKSLAQLPPKQTVYGVSNFWSHAKKTKPYPPKTIHLFRRGNIHHPEHEVSPGALSSLTHLPGRFPLSDPGHEASRRAALADWLAHPENPLTWRSIVNRVWHYHFGKGLCDTPNDFGRMGSTPSHPELLDYLARWFRDEAKGSLKQLHRLILTSQTWQQSSQNACPEIDADNRLLSHMNRRRLDAETFRDSLLRLPGKIDLTMGGDGIEQFVKSKGLNGSSELDYDAFDWNSPQARRRTIYRVVWRGIPDPFLEALDFPDLGILAPNRTSSVSSLQSLALFNNNFVLHTSEWLADHAREKHPTLDSQITCLTQLLWLRPPTPDELTSFKSYAQRHALPALARILINSNEFLYLR